MTEIEVPLEPVQERLLHEASHASGWISTVALASAIIAALAAVAALMTGHHGNEAMIDQIQASDSWAHFQAKSLKASILSSKIAVLEALGKPVHESDREKSADYLKEQKELTELAQEKEASSRLHLKHHEILASAVTFFQVSIAIAAISVLTRRRKYWYVSLGFGAAGVVAFALGLF